MSLPIVTIVINWPTMCGACGDTNTDAEEEEDSEVDDNNVATVLGSGAPDSSELEHGHEGEDEEGKEDGFHRGSFCSKKRVSLAVTLETSCFSGR